MELTQDDDLDMAETRDPNDPDNTENFFEEVNADIEDREMQIEGENAGDMTAMMDALQCLGVQPEVAATFSVKIIKAARKPTILEVYGGDPYAMPQMGDCAILTWKA